MNKWFKLIVINDDISHLDAAIEDFEKELILARADCEIAGNLEQAASRLPGHFEYRYRQLQEIEGILEFMNIELKKIRSGFFRSYKEQYNTDLTASSIEKYIDGEADVVTWTKSLNSVALIRNQFAGVIKSMDMKNFQIGHVTKLKVMGIEDATI